MRPPRTIATRIPLPAFAVEFQAQCLCNFRHILVGDAEGSGRAGRRRHVCADIYSVFRNLWESKLTELQLSCSFVDAHGAYSSKFWRWFQIRVRYRGHNLSRLVFPKETSSYTWK